MSLITIPDEATICRVLTRHAKSVQEGPQGTRTLTPEGVELAMRVKFPYIALMMELSEKFGPPETVASAHVRAVLTAWEITHAKQISTDPRLTLVVSLKKIQNGEWIKAQKIDKRTIGQIISAVHADLSMISDQPYDARMADMEHFLLGIERDSKPLVHGFGHEPEPSLLALKKGWLPEDQVGLKECDSLIVFSNAGEFIKMVRFNPLDHIN